ncbi:MAG: LptF/LptG family permease [Halanaerobiales bacterium]
MFKLWRKRIIDLYILREVLIPYLVGVAIITIIGLSNFLFQLTDLIIIKDIPANVVFELLLYQLPDIIVQTFPIAILFATMSGMSRLNRENEFTALRLGGVSLYRLILPMVLLGIVISSLTFYINEGVVPWSNHRAQNIIRRNILKQPGPDIQENVFFKGPEGRLFFVNKFDEEDNRLEKIVVYNLPDKKDFPEIITASYGEIIDNKWRLEGGIIHRYNEKGELHRAVMFEQMEYEITGEVDNFFGDQRTTSEMSRERLRKDIELFRKSGIDVGSLLIDYHLKLSMPLAALIFILIGTPLSLSSKDSRSASIILTIIIVFLYYLVLSLSRSFGKNGRIPPLLAAWLPNLTFGLIGVALLIWRETWQNFVSRFVPFFSIIIFCGILLISGQNAGAETIKLDHADHLSYNRERQQFEVNGEINGRYRDFHIFADKVIIKTADGEEKEYTSAETIEMEKGMFSGCDQDPPHYYFDAGEVVIYPDDHLIARNVVFWELGGKLPLFYWPYLYISLKDRDQKLIPEVGYNSRRGWFIKTTYNYRYQDRLPGELYLDYYQISGAGAGFKQHFLYEPDLKAYLYLYGQENRTDIPGLFNWRGEISIDNERSNWTTDTDIKYINYDDYSDLTGDLSVVNRAENWNIRLDSSFDSTDYYQSDYNDDQEINLDLGYNLDLAGSWRLNLDYERDYRYNIEDGLARRWQGDIGLSRRVRPWSYGLSFIRRAPYTEEEDEDINVTHLRWPEIEVGYQPPGSFDYKVVAGRYYENVSGIEGLRGKGIIGFNNSWYPFENTRISNTQHLSGGIYRVFDDSQDNSYGSNYYNSDYYYTILEDIPYQVTYDNKVVSDIDITDSLSWKNTYFYRDYYGQTPFNLDEISIQEYFKTGLNYRRDGWNISLDSGYNLMEERYYPLSMKLKKEIKEGWNISAGTTYNIEESNFDDLIMTNKYRDDIWQINNLLRYDLNRQYVKKIENRLTYELEEEWYFEVNSIYDNQEDRFRRANLALKKVFHCRSLTFKYDHINEEYTLEYNINLFPDHQIMVGSSEDEPFMYDLGIEELMDN